MSKTAHPSADAQNIGTYSTRKLVEEPLCLIKPTSKWYRPGQGFTCRQIMMPLMIISACLLVMIVVQAIQLFRTGGLELIAWFTFIVPCMMLALAIKAMLFVRQSLLDPLTQVRFWVSKVRAGDLTARMPALATGEFNELAEDINGLAGRMETLHGDLETEVRVQTSNLAKKTQALELLHEVVTRANKGHETGEVLRYFMGRLADVYQATAVVVRVLEAGKLTLLDSQGIQKESSFMAPAVPIKFVWKNNIFGADKIHVRTETINETLTSQDGVRTIRQIISVPLQYRDSILGCYQLFVSANDHLEPDRLGVLETMGQHLGVFLEQSRLDLESGKMLMAEERAKLANELHDSLAQTLASLRFQTRILDETLHQGNEQITWEELEKLEDQVEVANSELRELIGQFRAPMQERDIVISIQKVVDKFRRDTGVDVFLQNEWQQDTLSVEQRTDVIRIVQEALANIKKHAEASSVRVLLRNTKNGYRVVVEDDGKGYEDSTEVVDGSGHHIGQQIMRERAENLQAKLRLESEPGEGSVVGLDFEYISVLNDEPSSNTQSRLQL